MNKQQFENKFGVSLSDLQAEFGSAFSVIFKKKGKDSLWHVYDYSALDGNQELIFCDLVDSFHAFSLQGLMIDCRYAAFKGLYIAV